MMYTTARLSSVFCFCSGPEIYGKIDWRLFELPKTTV